ncbi:MAG: glycosyltransferase family 61 protein [Bacteroidota bacterium]
MQITRKKPVNYNSNDVELFQNEFCRTIIRQNKTSHKSVLLNKKSVFHSLNPFHKNNSNETYKLKKISLSNLYHIIVKRDIKTISKEVSLITDGWSQGFFHWLFDALPKLIELEKEGKKNKIILHSSFWTSFYKESLLLLGYNESDFIFFSTQFVFCKKIKLPTYIEPTGNYDEKIIVELHDRFYKALNKSSSKPFRKIYISRNKSKRRRLYNEAELLPILNKYGFETVYTENLNFTEQVQLFLETEIVIGVHGAGLSNMLFMKPETKVMELRFENETNDNCYFSLASALKINYFYCLGKKIDTDIKIENKVFSQEIEKLIKH